MNLKRKVSVGLFVLIGLVALPASASAGLSPSVITFPVTSPGQTSAAQMVTLTNNAASPLTVNIALNNNADVFQIDVSNCPAVLAPAASCGLPVSFKPVAAGNFYSEVSVPGSGYFMALVGNTPLPAGTITPSADQDFGFAVPGVPVTKHFVVKSTGPIPLPIAEIRTSGSGDVDFQVVQPDACVGDLATDATCEFDVKFEPEPGFSTWREGLLVVMDAEENALLLVGLSGTTSVAEYTVAPTFKDFGEAAIGTGLTRTPSAFTITSTGDAPLPYAGSSVGGGNAPDSFPINDDCPPLIAVDQSCSVQVSFDPKAGQIGPRSTALTVKAGINPHAYTTILMTGTATSAPVLPPPPPVEAELSLKLKSAKRAKRGRVLVIKATVTNTGETTATSLVLKSRAPKKLARRTKALRIPRLEAGHSITRKIRIKVKMSARPGRKLKVNVSAVANGVPKKAARRIVRIR